MLAAEEAARRGGSGQMHLRVRPTNPAAVALYEGLGFAKQPETNWRGRMTKAL